MSRTSDERGQLDDQADQPPADIEAPPYHKEDERQPGLLAVLRETVVLVEKVSYRFGDVRRGDVVVFVHDEPGFEPSRPSNPVTGFFSGLGQAIGVVPPSDRDFIKRVIGLPGDTIDCSHGDLYRNGQPVKEDYLDPGTETQNCTRTIVGPGELFVMGDNRVNSQDSRTFGPIHRDDVVGRAFVRIWPLTHTGWLRRDR